MKNLFFALALLATNNLFSQVFFQNGEFDSFLYSCDVYNEFGVKTMEYDSERSHLRIYQYPFNKGEAKRIYFFDLLGNQTDVYLLRYNSAGELVATHEGSGFVQMYGE